MTEERSKEEKKFWLAIKEDCFTQVYGDEMRITLKVWLWIHTQIK